MMVKHFYDLEVWKKANELTVKIYKLTKNFPNDERYGMVDQMRRASSSVGANIAEGFGRYYQKDKIKFFRNSRGSLYEVQNFLILALDLGFAEKDAVKNLINDYQGLAYGLNKLIKVIGSH